MTKKVAKDENENHRSSKEIFEFWNFDNIMQWFMIKEVIKVCKMNCLDVCIGCLQIQFENRCNHIDCLCKKLAIWWHFVLSVEDFWIKNENRAENQTFVM